MMILSFFQSVANRFNQKLTAFAKDEEGATAAEYGLIAALIAVAIIVAVTALGGKLKQTFNNITNNLPSGNPS